MNKITVTGTMLAYTDVCFTLKPLEDTFAAKCSLKRRLLIC